MDGVGTMVLSSCTVSCSILQPLHLHSKLRQMLLFSGVTQRKEHHTSHSFTQCVITWRRAQADDHIGRRRSEQLEVGCLGSTSKSQIHRHFNIWKLLFFFNHFSLSVKHFWSLCLYLNFKTLPFWKTCLISFSQYCLIFSEITLLA